MFEFKSVNAASKMIEISKKHYHLSMSDNEEYNQATATAVAIKFRLVTRNNTLVL